MEEFIQTVAPLLRDAKEQPTSTIETLRDFWPPERLIPLLVWPDDEVVELAVRCLGLTGAMTHTRYLAALLPESSPKLLTHVEEGLWRIWHRGGSGWAVRVLKQASEEMRQENFAEALSLLDTLTLAEPTFAEAHHQHGLVMALTDDVQAALGPYRQALRLNPYHFAAAQGIGHAYLDRGVITRAVEYYEHAFRIHPRLEGVREMVEGLRKVVSDPEFIRRDGSPGC